MAKLSLKYIFVGLVIYVELLIVGLRNHIYTKVIPEWKNLGIIVDCIAERLWLTVVTIVVLAVLFFYVIGKEMGIRKFSLLRFVVFATTASMFYSLQDVPLTGGFIFTVVLGCIFVSLCTLEVIKMCWNDNEFRTDLHKEKQYDVKGFSNISKEDELYDLGWGTYAKNLFMKLVATNVEEAYAVGLNAQWGYGKTTFLNEIKKNLTEDEIQIDFNPWLSSAPDQIVKDFFENLKDKLRTYDSHLDDEIDNYVNLLINLDVHPIITALAKVWEGSNSKSIVGSRERIQNRINHIGKKIVVMIDDLDRLEKDEIYEVLKLIRNTAKFKNLIYIVAYDRQYICSTLKQKGIVMPESYLYKIFQMEVLLPAFESDLIEKKLIEELQKQLEGDVQERFIKSIEIEINRAYRTNRAVGYFLKNFRDVKRFSNMLCLEIEQVAATKLKFDIMPWCLFWLEIIHYSREEVYLKLRSNHAELLEEIGSDGKLMFKKGLELEEHVSGVLAYLFDATNDWRSISYTHSFDTYFSLRPSVYKVGWTEFISAINQKEGDTIKHKMKDWLDSPEGKLESLFLKFKGFKVGKSLINNCAFINYFNALQFWVDYKNDASCKHYVPEICHFLVDRNNCNEAMIDNIRHCFDQMIKHFLEKHENCFVVMKILAKVCPYDIGEEYIINDNVIGKEKIEEYIKMTFNLFIDSHEIKVEDLCDDKSEIQRLIRSARVDETREMGGVSFFVFDNLLRDYFKNKKTKDSATVLMNTFKIDREMIVEGCDDDEIISNLIHRISKYFVSVVWYRNFLWQCVAEDRVTIDKYLKENRL